MKKVISVQHLRKEYGDVVAVDDLSFEINDGHVYGFLGPNGAGKSTTMNIMTGCLSATGGKVMIDGHDIYEEANKAKRAIGYLPEMPPLYLSDTVEEYLRFVAQAKGIKNKEIEAEIQEVLKATRLETYVKRRIQELSKGYRQRVGIAQCLLGKPKVIILDEPTVGLDPKQMIEIRELIRELGKNHTVILSSHILSEVQTICDEILIINKGKLIAFDKTEDLEKHFHSKMEIEILTDAKSEEVKSLLGKIDLIESMIFEKGEYLKVKISFDSDDIHALAKAVYLAFKKSDAILYEMNLKKATLEDVFLELTREEVC